MHHLRDASDSVHLSVHSEVFRSGRHARRRQRIISCLHGIARCALKIHLWGFEHEKNRNDIGGRIRGGRPAGGLFGQQRQRQRQSSRCRQESQRPASVRGNTGNAGAKGSYPDYAKGFPEKVNLEIPVYERAFEGWNVTDNYYTRLIQKEFGDKYNVNVKFVPITRSSEVTDYEQLLASHKAPDIIFHYDMPQALAYYGEDVMQPLDWNEIANYAPTYWKNMGETDRKFGIVDGKNAFFSRRASECGQQRDAHSQRLGRAGRHEGGKGSDLPREIQRHAPEMEASGARRRRRKLEEEQLQL